DPFPDEDVPPETSDESRGPVNFLVFGQAASSNQTLSIFHLADGRRRTDVVNFPARTRLVTSLDDVETTLIEIKELTRARKTDISQQELAEHPEAPIADDVWTTVLQEALDTRDPGQLQSIATSLTPYVAADRGLNTGRITDLARSLRHVPTDNIASCTLPEDI